jgi:DNA replication and repair protein RecF
MIYLESLYLRNFRGYEQASLQFSPSLNLILGNNAQGKTNLLEAICLLSMGRSFRTRHAAELIREGQPAFFLDATFMKDGLSQTITLSFDGKHRKLRLNTTDYSSFTQLLGLLPIVLYAPGDTLLITGSPAERRRFIDLHIAQIDPVFVQHAYRYLKALKQRNHLLRQKAEADLPAWEESLALSGSYLMKKRKEAIAHLNELARQSMQLLSEGKDLFEMGYESSLPSDEDSVQFLAEQLQKSRRRDLYVGNTTVGPHLDEIAIQINQRLAKLYSSEGQKRTCLAALKLAEWERLKSTVGFAPLMSVDDFTIHLDTTRQTLFLNELQKLGQVFLTSPYTADMIDTFTEKKIFSVEGGKIS